MIASTAIAQALAQVRERTQLTDEALARVIGVRQATFTRWRNGTLAVADRHAARIASLLGEPMELVTEMLRSQPRPPGYTPGSKGTIGHLLREYERRNGFTPQQAYNALGVEVSTYHKWRKNQSIPGAQAIAPLAEAMGVREERVVMACYRTELWRLAQKGS